MLTYDIQFSTFEDRHIHEKELYVHGTICFMSRW
jgi:hypothetical protein